MSDRVKATLAQQGRTKDWLANELDISPSYVTLLLKGERRWTVELMARAAHALGVPEWILFMAEDIEPINLIDLVE